MCNSVSDPQGIACEDESGEGEVEEEKPRKKHVTLHDKHVIGYENRIRAYSTPDKIFRYFATLQILEGDGQAQIYMTPEDFLRSITPGWIQPDGLGLDQFLPKMTTEQWKVHPAHKKTDPNSIFSKLGNHGLISFSDYLFLLTLLASKFILYSLTHNFHSHLNAYNSVVYTTLYTYMYMYRCTIGWEWG